MPDRYRGPERRETCEDGCVGMTDKLNTKADEMYKDINKKVPWVYFVFIIVGLCSIAALFLDNNSKAISKVEAYMAAKNAEQDAIILEVRREMKETRDASLSALSEMKAHREFTEKRK